MAWEIVLKNYSVNPSTNIPVYTLNGASPISIKDQIVRASLLIEALFDSGTVYPDSKLTIVGASVAGLAFAILATQKGLKHIEIIEESDQLLPTFQQCTTRWIDPNQYDWPHDHWTKSIWNGPDGSGLSIKEGAASDIAHDLINTFYNECKNSNVEEFCGFKCIDYNFNNGTLAVNFKTSKTTWKNVPSTTCDALVFATGFGQEKTEVPIENSKHTYVSPKFWENDTFLLPNWGFSSAKLNYGLHVVGGGDGALQDALRLTTGMNSAKEIIGHLLATIQPNTLSEMLIPIFAWEQDFKEFLRSGATEQSMKVRRENLHRWYTSLARDLKKIISAPTFNLNSSVTLVTEDSYFSDCYPLNRLLAILLIELDLLKWIPNHTLDRLKGSTNFIQGSKFGDTLGVEAVLKDSRGKEHIYMTDGLVIRFGLTRSMSLLSKKLPHKLAFQPCPMNFTY